MLTLQNILVISIELSSMNPGKFSTTVTVAGRKKGTESQSLICTVILTVYQFYTR